MAKQFAYSGGKGTANGIPTGIDWAAVNLKDPVSQAELSQAIQDYFKEVSQVHAFGRKQLITGTKYNRTGHMGNLPSQTDLEVNYFGPQVDAGWQAFFRYVDKTASKNPTFNFASVSAQGITFKQTKEGEPIQVVKVSDSAPNSVSSVTHRGALGIDDDAKRFDEYGTYEENVQRVPSMYDDYLADFHYALFTALGAGVNEAWDTDLVTTLNNAGAQILEDCGDTYGLGDNPTFALMYNHRRWSLVEQALASNFQLPNSNSSNKLQFNIIPVPTRKITTTNLYLGLPGNDMVSVEWDGLGSEFGRDISRGVDTQVWLGRRNAAIGNTLQVRRITPV